ncbi:hypothetical protein ACFWP0_17650 [Achromobacter sp. NPDC058515]|uniref:hypothetical protein n=1 Tax=Achromobacter sp. NPDC058515 TaxID=3346533 RepID=UPI00365D32C7
MTTLSRSAHSLAWRLAVAAVLLRLGYIALIQIYTLTGPSPYLDRVRESYSQPEMLAPLLANMAASLVIAGLATWGAMRRWLARNDTAAVDQPGRLFGTFLALQALYTLCLSAGLALAQNAMLGSLIKGGSLLDEWFGLGVTGQFLAMNLLTKAVTIPLEIIGVCLAVRIATWTVAPAGPAGGPVHGRRHAAWIAGLTVLAWQLSISITLGGFLQMHTLGAGWLEYALGYWVLPAIVMALCALACLKVLPRELGRARIGRAVAHGSIAFWFAQAAGVGLGVLALRAMTWNQLAFASESYVAAGVTLLIYAALLALGCLIGARALYRGGKQDPR